MSQKKGTKIISEIKAKKRMMREAKLATIGDVVGGEGGEGSNKSSTKRRRISCKKSDFIELDTFVISTGTKPASNNTEMQGTTHTNTSENPKTDSKNSNNNNQTVNTYLASVSLNENSPLTRTSNYLNAINMESGVGSGPGVRRVSLNLPIEYTLQDSKISEKSTTIRKRSLVPLHQQHMQKSNGLIESASKLNGCKKIEIFLLASVLALILANLHFIFFLNINIEDTSSAAAAAAAAAAVAASSSSIIASNDEIYSNSTNLNHVWHNFKVTFSL